MHEVSLKDLSKLALGAAFLGSGGGGDTTYGVMAASNCIERYGPVKILQLADLHDDDLIVPLASMGAPSVGREMIPSFAPFEQVIKRVEDEHGRRATALSVAEIGGSNALTPLWMAARAGLPVVDADLIGRAFPELQMNSANVFKTPIDKCFMADAFGNTVVIKCADPRRVEYYARLVTVGFGSRAAFAMGVMQGSDAKKTMVPGGIVRAVRIGTAIEQARSAGVSPLDNILEASQGRCLGNGMIADVDQSVQNGFLRGLVRLENAAGETRTLDFQNEFLRLSCGDRVLATTPDIISVVDSENGTPISTDGLAFGAQVHVVAAPAPDIWYSDAGLSLAGPEAFGFRTIE